MAEKQKTSYVKELTKGFLKENPVLRLVLGTCPTLATSTSVVNGIGMGIAATIVLICSNVAISAMRKIIPAKARIPAYIVIIASFVTMVQMLVKAFVPALDQSLGVFLPLIVVNCIILGRAEAYASKNPVLLSAIDGLGMGIGFTAALFCMGAVREIIGAGTFLSGIDTMLGAYIDLGTFTGFDFVDELASFGLAPMTLFILPAGGFFVFGMLMALANKLAERKGLKSATLRSCSGCPHASFCKQLNGDGECSADEEAQSEENKTEIKKEKIKPEKSEVKSEEAKTEPEEAKAEPEEVKAEPEEAKAEPEEAKTESEEVKAEPEEAKSEPEEAKSEPEEAKSEPEEVKSEPEKVKAEPEETKTEPEEAKAEPEEAKTEPEEVRTEAAPETQPSVSYSSNEGSFKRNKKKKNKNKAKAQAITDFTEPLPEVIPEFLKKQIAKNKEQEDNKE